MCIRDSVFAVPYAFDVDGEDVMGLLAQAYELGLPKGSSRCGCFEIQTDAGIWSSSTGGRLSKANASFSTWEQLEAAE